MSYRHYVVTAAELHDSLAEAGLRIVDCRFDLCDPGAGRSRHVQGHIPGAVYADLDQDLAGPAGGGAGRHPLPAIPDIEDTLSRLGIDGSTPVVLYDDTSGALAARGWWLLRWLGHDRARVLDGGYAAWLREGCAVERGEVRVPRRRFRARVRPELVVTTGEIEAAGAARLRLVDARDASRFSGEEEPIDVVAGHVPGAVNLPFVDCVDERGCWRPATELRERLEAALGGDTDRPWTTMCGSGVTACHLVISALLAGCREPRVYAGSWSEWISDRGREIADSCD